jgi:hypothetical protein
MKIFKKASAFKSRRCKLRWYPKKNKLRLTII